MDEVPSGYAIPDARLVRLVRLFVRGLFSAGFFAGLIVLDLSRPAGVPRARVSSKALLCARESLKTGDGSHSLGLESSSQSFSDIVGGNT